MCWPGRVGPSRRGTWETFAAPAQARPQKTRMPDRLPTSRDRTGGSPARAITLTITKYQNEKLQRAPSGRCIHRLSALRTATRRVAACFLYRKRAPSFGPDFANGLWLPVSDRRADDADRHSMSGSHSLHQRGTVNRRMHRAAKAKCGLAGHCSGLRPG